MLKPSEIQKNDLKKGLGYKKKDVDELLNTINESYEKLYNENIDLKDKLAVLNDGLQYYKSIEKTLQKALVLAQKTSDDNHAEALKRARTIEIEARVKADKIVSDARKELKDLKSKAAELIIKFDAYKGQVKALTKSQLELMENEAYNLYLKDIKSGFFEQNSAETQIEEFQETANLMPYDDMIKKIEEDATQTVSTQNEVFVNEEVLIQTQDGKEQEIFDPITSSEEPVSLIENDVLTDSNETIYLNEDEREEFLKEENV